MRTTIVFFCGVICSLLVAAAAFRGGTPVDYTFTYQGQLRNAGALVNGPVDLRITLWDSDAAGAQVGPINNYQALPITDGRFAVGLNFGGTAFDGSNRWVQLEFRSPAGSGQYLTLNPRDKIMATPYAMFALNGGNGIWNYNPKLQSVSVLGQKVGIGTANPTAALEVVGTGGDDSVKLPAGSIGINELANGSVAWARAFQGVSSFQPPYGGGYLEPINVMVNVSSASDLSILATMSNVGLPGNLGGLQLLVDGAVVSSGAVITGDSYTEKNGTVAATVSVQAGAHQIQLRLPGYINACEWNCNGYFARGSAIVVSAPRAP